MFDIDDTKIDHPEILAILKKIDKHSLETNRRLESIEQTQAYILKAFPGGDIEGHSRYHETVIEILREKRRLRVAIQEKTISGLVWSIIVGFAILLWQGILTLLNEGK